MGGVGLVPFGILSRETERVGRGERRALACVLALGAVLQGVLVARDWSSNPFAHVPLNDAEVYWRWAGDLAAGEWIGGAPYFSAPLYPWFVGLLRACGAGLLALYVAQALLHLGTAALVWRAARVDFGATAAVLGALAWVLLDDASYGTTRVLNGGVQCLLVAWTWERAVAWRRGPTSRRAVLLGVALGLAVLSNPTLLLAVPIFAAWVFWVAPRERRARCAACAGVVALLVIAPATVHNALACGEFIPVSAQAGVTFVHGNAPGADGTYHAIEGVSSDRSRQNVDARELVRAQTDGSWSATSSAFFQRGLDWWRAEPGAAAELFARKLWWFVSGRRYGDIYLPVLEARDGWSIATRVAPLCAAWLALPALLTLALLARDPRRFLPELVLVLAPLATVAIFWYSPRYRLPAMPLVCALAMAALAPRPLAPSAARVSTGARAAGWIALLASLASGPLNVALGFDDIESHRAQYEYLAGKALIDTNRVEEALPRLREATRLGHEDAAVALGDALRRLGRPLDALELLRDNALRQPKSAYAHRALAVALVNARELAQARMEFEAALALDPRDYESLAGLGGVLYELGDPRAAVERQRAALALRPDLDVAHYNLAVALERLGQFDEAELEYAAALQTNPTLARASQHLAELHVRRGDFSGALSELTLGLQRSPQDRGLTTTRAWLLATAPDAKDRDGQAAVALIEPLVQSERDDPGLWNIYAAALAESNRFPEAIQAAQRTLELLHQQNLLDAITETRSRLDLYRTNKPFHQPSH